MMGLSPKKISASVQDKENFSRSSPPKQKEIAQINADASQNIYVRDQRIKNIQDVNRR